MTSPNLNEPEQERENQGAPHETAAETATSEPHTETQQDGSGSFVVPRNAFNYVVIAVVFFGLGGVMGSYVFPADGGEATLPDNFEAVVRGAVADAIDESGIAAAEAEDTGAVPGERYEVVVEDGADPFWGAEDAPVTIVEFSDFTCGFCGRFASETMPALQEEFGDQVKFVYMDFPFLSQMSLPAAMAAECADDQGEFWAYHDALFENQRGLNQDMLRTMAEDLELDMDAFNTCMDDQVHLQEIREDYEMGVELGVSGTPGFFVNGTFVSGAQPISVFRDIIQQELEQVAAEGSEAAS